MNGTDASARSPMPAPSVEPDAGVLVTGATGFIGRSVCRGLLAAGFEVLAGTRGEASDVEPGCRPVCVDVRSGESVLEAVARCHVVVHLAGIVGNRPVDDDIAAAVDVNVGGTLNVLEAARVHGRPVVFASVGNVGDGTPYAITKSTAERFCAMYARELGVRALSLRIFNVYGPGQSALTGKLVPVAVARALAGGDLECHGDGSRVEDFVYVDDVARAVVDCVRELLGGAPSFGPRDVGTGIGLSVREVLDRVVAVTASSSRVVTTPARVGALSAPLVASGAGRMPLGPCVDFDAGLARVADAERRSPSPSVAVAAAPERAPVRSVGALTKGRVLVTGGSGFIGTHVVDRLLARGFEVTVLDRVGLLRPTDARFVLGDLCDSALVQSLAPRFDAIVNLAAVLGTSETVAHARSTLGPNLLGALHIFEAARRHGVRVVQITVGNHWMNNPYAITKSAAERLGIFYNQRFGTRISVVRGLNAYGEFQKSWPVRKIIPNFVLPALRDGELVVYGDGEQRMDMIYVGDLAEILVRALVLDHGVWGTTFEAGTGHAPTVASIAKTVLRAVPGSRARVVRVPMRQGEPERSLVIGDPRTLAPLGIEPEHLVPLEAGIARTVAFYAANGDAFG